MDVRGLNFTQYREGGVVLSHFKRHLLAFEEADDPGPEELRSRALLGSYVSRPLKIVGSPLVHYIVDEPEGPPPRGAA